MIRRFIVLLACATLVACVAPSPTQVNTPTASPSDMALPAPDGLILIGGGGAVRVSAVCWDQDPTACPWQAGVAVIVPSKGAAFVLQVVDASPTQAMVSWRPYPRPGRPTNTPPASGTVTDTPGVLASHLEGEDVMLDAIPPRPATLRFEASWTTAAGVARSAVFFFRLVPTTQAP